MSVYQNSVYANNLYDSQLFQNWSLSIFQWRISWSDFKRFIQTVPFINEENIKPQISRNYAIVIVFAGSCIKRP